MMYFCASKEPGDNNTCNARGTAQFYQVETGCGRQHQTYWTADSLCDFFYLFIFFLPKEYSQPFYTTHLTAEHFVGLVMRHEKNCCFYVAMLCFLWFYLLLWKSICFRIPSRILTLCVSPKCPQIIARRKRPGRSAKNPAVGAEVKSTGLQLLGQTEAAEQSE